MTEDSQQGERRQEDRRQGDRREEERRQHHDRKTCIELAKHIGVLSVGLSVIIHGIAMTPLLDYPAVTVLTYLGTVFVLMSFIFSVLIIFWQLMWFE